MQELRLERSYRRGDRGKQVALIQEWLGLNGCNVVIDGSFGPATESAVRRFQKEAGMRPDGVVGRKTFAALVEPMQKALEPIAPGGRSLGALVCLYAKRHLEGGPREIGGQNMGPWVRLYMDGRQGAEWPWCAGFACFVVRQASVARDEEMPFDPSVSCDSLAAGARERGLLMRAGAGFDSGRITPGSLFLNRRTETDWVHTGVVLECRQGVIETIEGNTNDDGSREGYEVCHRWRGLKEKDFILLT